MKLKLFILKHIMLSDSHYSILMISHDFRTTAETFVKSLDDVRIGGTLDLVILLNTII